MCRLLNFVRPSLVALVAVAGLASTTLAQSMDRNGGFMVMPGRGNFGFPTFTPRPMQFHVPSNGNFAGIGQGRNGIDLLSWPAAQRNFPFATPFFQPTPRPWGWNGGTGMFHDHFHHGGADASAVFVGNDRAFTEGSGLVVNGSWSSDHWKIKFHLGGPFGVENRFNPINTNYPYYGYPYFAGYYAGGYGYGYPYSYSTYSGYDNTQAFGYGGGMDAAPMQSPPAQTTQTQTAPLSPIELAVQDFRSAQFDAAAAQVRKHLKAHPEDSFAIRMLAIALLETKHFDDGVGMLRQAYRTDPNLAAEPIVASDLGIDDAELRRLASGTVLYAHRADSGSAWLSVATLLQAQGKRQAAREMVAKAEKKGVEAEIVAPMKAALQ